MKTEMQKIDNMKKVEISLKAGTGPGTTDLFPASHRFEFIYGLGSEGLTPFEYKLAGKTEGDEIEFNIGTAKIHETFEHLAASFPFIPGNAADVWFKARVDKVSSARDHEIVKSMAKIAACGDGCCGDHCCG